MTPPERLTLKSIGFPFLAFSNIEDYALAKSWIKTGMTILLFGSVLRMFLAAKKDTIWMAPKLLLGAVWAIFPVALLSTIMLGVMGMILPEVPTPHYGVFFSMVLILIALTALASRLLIALRARWLR